MATLPILLDGTCNGLQPLSAIANVINLAEKVNICASREEDDPKDVYSELLIPIKENITKFVESNPEHYNISKLNITRKLIKRGIMTITYGVTVKGILKQLEKEFFVKPDLINGHFIFRAKDISLGDHSLSRKYLYRLSEIIYNVLFNKHPILEDILVYFQSMAKLLKVLDYLLHGLHRLAWYCNRGILNLLNTILPVLFKVKVEKLLYENLS